MWVKNCVEMYVNAILASKFLKLHHIWVCKPKIFPLPAIVRLHICKLRAIALVNAKFLSILPPKKKKNAFSILQTHFYKTLTSVCLFYHLFYLNNYFPHFFILFISTCPKPAHKLTSLPSENSLSLSLSLSLNDRPRMYWPLW